MKQTIFKKMLSCIAVMMVIIGMGMLASCKNNTSADLVVYGKIFTSEGNQVVEAFAVKDGKYIYVGDKAGAEAFIEEGKTEVVDYLPRRPRILSCRARCPYRLLLRPHAERHLRARGDVLHRSRRALYHGAHHCALSLCS